jgi:arylsulfatase A-like enzyme
VLLITTEGVRAEDVGAGRYPHLDRLAREGTVSTQAVTPSTSSAVAHAALWTQRHPLTLPMVRDDQPLPPDAATLAQAAQPSATTAAFVSTTALSDAGLDRGFDVFDDSFAPLPGLDRLALVRWARGVAWLRRPPTDTAHAAAAWLADHRDGRFLLWVHLALPPSSVREGRDQPSLDAAIGEVIDALGPAADRTRVALVGVRGARHTPGATPWAGLADDVVRVPMIVRSPGVAGAKVDAQVSVLRAATDLALFGGWTTPGDAGAAKPDAASLATTVLGDDGVGHARLALRQVDLKLIVDPDSQDASYYDLTLDPGETTDRSGTAPDFVVKARMSLAPELAALTRAREVPPLGSWRARRLRALAEE